MRNVVETKNISSTDAFHWLTDNFGSSRAVAAMVVAQEQYSSEHLREWSLERHVGPVSERDSLQKITAPGA